MRLELHPDARGELRSAAVWYDGHRAGLGDEFVNEVTAALVNAASTPASFPVWPGTSSTAIRIRRAVLSRFPYAIAFEAEMDTLLKADIFFVVTTVAVFVVAAIVIWALVYLIKILRNVEDISETVKKETKQFSGKGLLPSFLMRWMGRSSHKGQDHARNKLKN